MNFQHSNNYFGVFLELLQNQAAVETHPYTEEESRLYDITHAFEEDLPFYFEFCKEHKGPILEIGTGTGRVLMHLASLGYPMTGIEKQKDMILRFQEKGIPDNLTIIEADVWDAVLPKEQKTILLPLNFINYIIGKELKINLLKKLLNHSSKDGFLIIDTDRRISQISGLNEPRIMVAETIDSEDPLLYIIQSYLDETTGIELTNNLKIPLGNSLGKLPTISSWKWHQEADMENVIKESGWNIVAAYGGYCSQPLTLESSHRLYICNPLNK